MRKHSKWMSLIAISAVATMLFAAPVAADEGVDLNSMSLDDIIAQAQEEGDVQSVGMPDEWANWGNAWKAIKDKYGINHTDADMSSAEELQMFQTEGENGTKDIGDVGQAFGQQAIDQDLVQGYKTSYWDSVPDWAKGEDGKWMMAYTGATAFLTNTDQVKEAPKSWADVEKGDYKVAIGDINSFKAVNDTYGHRVGDDVLKGFADILVQVFPAESVFRFGGDEFLVIEKNSDLDGLKEKLGQVNAMFSALKISGINSQLGCSFGCVTACPKDPSEFFDYLTQADQLLYQEKVRINANR